MFISLEGTDGAGKSAQINLLKKYLEKHLDKEVICLYDPGSTSISEKLREIVLDKDNSEMCATCEALIYSASRAQMVQEKIIPALNDEKIVISDRFVDSSLVYQGFTRELGYDIIKQVNDFAVSNVYPEITFFLHLDTSISMKRKNAMKELDRMELEGIDFQEKVRLSYLELALQEPDRIKIIDASKSIEEVHTQIITKLNEYLNK